MRTDPFLPGQSPISRLEVRMSVGFVRLGVNSIVWKNDPCEVMDNIVI